MQEKHIWLNSGEKIYRIPVSRIKYISVENKSCQIHTDNDSCKVAVSLRKLIAVLPEEIFFRVHRKYIINRERLTGFDSNEIQIGPVRLPLARSHSRRLAERYDTVRIRRQRIGDKTLFD